MYLQRKKTKKTNSKKKLLYFSVIEFTTRLNKQFTTF